MPVYYLEIILGCTKLLVNVCLYKERVNVYMCFVRFQFWKVYVLKLSV